jgi:hypothetical protein
VEKVIHLTLPWSFFHRLSIQGMSLCTPMFHGAAFSVSILFTADTHGQYNLEFTFCLHLHGWICWITLPIDWGMFIFYVVFWILFNYLFLKHVKVPSNWWFCLTPSGESCSVEKELEVTIATNAVYQDKTNILFSVFILNLVAIFHQIYRVCNCCFPCDNYFL